MRKQDKALLTCPRCGHQQMESRAAFSSACRNCGEYWRVQDLLKPPPKAPEAAPERKRITCFDCAAEFDVPASAQSTMCKKCSSYIDLHDYDIGSAVSKNFKTKGQFVIQPAGYVFNSETIAREAVIKGRFIGKLTVEGTLTLYSTANIKGEFKARQLIVPAGNQFRWNGEIKVDSVDLEGELVANVLACESVHVRPTGRLFGAVLTRCLVADTGAVLSVSAKIH